MRSVPAIFLGLVFSITCTTALADSELVYIALDQPCRLVDSRASQGGPGPLTAAHGNYLFGTNSIDTASAAQNGSSVDCGINYTTAYAVSVSINQLNTTASGNIRAWASDGGSAGPAAGTAVYNPSVTKPVGGQVLYNGAYSTIPVGADGRFYLSVANGQLDLTINALGYWISVGSNNVIDRDRNAVALGDSNWALGIGSVSIGSHNYVLNDYAFAAGSGNGADGENGVVIGTGNSVGQSSTNGVAIGASNTVADVNGVAIGYDNTNNAANSIVLGYYAYAPASAPDSFVFSDGSLPQAGPTVGHQFWVRTTNGAVFYSSADLQSGVWLQAGAGAWTALSDRNAKTAVQPIDGRDVLDRVVAMPLATWQYKTQDAKYRHMGPMAQDFYAAFGLGESDTGIDTIDADGVALAAIQGLNTELKAEVAQRDREIAELRAQVAELAAAIKHPAGAASP